MRKLLLSLLLLLGVSCAPTRPFMVSPLTIPPFPLTTEAPVELPEGELDDLTVPNQHCGEHNQEHGKIRSHFDGPCLIYSSTTHDHLILRVTPRFSMASRTDVRVVIVHEGKADELLIGLVGDNYERTSIEPRRRKQTTVHWPGIPPGVYTVYVIALHRGEQVALASEKLSFGHMS